jgi:putative aldouronate transport system substrate-binding protein
MIHKYRSRAAMVAAGLLSLTLAFTSACSGGEEENKGEDLSAVSVGAMANYKVGDQFKATEALSFDILYNNHPNYPLNDQWLFWKELTQRTNVTLKPVAVPLSDYEQKRGLLIGAGDAPFIIPKTYPGQ